jgi:hypothetical protein
MDSSFVRWSFGVGKRRNHGAIAMTLSKERGGIEPD